MNLGVFTVEADDRSSARACLIDSPAGLGLCYPAQVLDLETSLFSGRRGQKKKQK